jgi:putative hydrolases of HD superfamily
MRDENDDGVALADGLRMAGLLKQLRRNGWIDRGIPRERVESVADHSFRVALLAWAAAALDPTLDRGSVLSLALLHDLAEFAAGDPTPYDPADLAGAADAAAFLDRRHRRSPERQAAKHAAEDAAIRRLTELLPPVVGADIAALWSELRSAGSPEARFVSEADKLETYLQSREYAAEFPGIAVGSFAAEVAEVVGHPVLAALRDAIASSDFFPPEAPNEPRRERGEADRADNEGDH